MKKITAFTFSMLFPAVLIAQIISGHVYRSETNSPLAFASVYYSGSSNGTSTNTAGEFRISLPEGNMPLVVSSIGYYSEVITSYSADSLLKIYLRPKTEVLKEVVVRNDGMSDAEKLKMFQKEFLGTSSFAQNCTITNLSDLDLFYSRKIKTLTVSSSQPIEIENPKLGYHITYFLDNFSLSPERTIFEGNFVFRELAGLSDQKEIAKNREKSYLGSRMQFIRALTTNTLSRNSFKISLPGSYDALDPGKILFTTAKGQKYVLLTRTISISHKGSLSSLSQTARVSRVDSIGFYDSGLSWAGKMSKERVGDLLPYEYRSATQKLLNIPDMPTAGNQKADSGFPKGLYFEKAYLHTDRDMYAVGDTLWYKAYLLNAQENTGRLTSGNLYVELVSDHSSLLAGRQMVRIKEGTGFGDFTLGDTLPPGQYRLRGYTSWMLNFGDNFIFDKEITVSGSSEPISDTALQPGSTKAPVYLSLPEEPHVNVRFYPEGGPLVEGISSIVAVKAEDDRGNGIPVKISISDNKGSQLAIFNTDSLGMAMFTMLPLKGQEYRAAITRDKISFVENLPAALVNGPVMRVSNQDGVITVMLSSILKSGGKNNGQDALLFARHAGKIYFQTHLHLKRDETLVKIAASDLPEGVTAITLIDAAQRPLCERLIFVHNADSTAAIRVTTNKPSYLAGEAVTVTIQSSANSQLSMAVVDAGVVPVQPGDIASYLLLESEIKGTIEQPRQYFDSTNVNRIKQIDLLLLTQGWMEFVWRRLADTLITMSHEAEDGVKISGTVKNRSGGQALAGINVSLYAAAAKETRLFSAKTDSLGRFSFKGVEYYGEQLLKLAAMDDKAERKGVIVLETVAYPSLKRTHLLNSIEITSDTMRQGAARKLEKSLVNRNTKKGSIRLQEVNIKTQQTVAAQNGVFVSFGPEQRFEITGKDLQFKTLDWWLLQNVNGALQGDEPGGGNQVVFSGTDTLRYVIEGPFKGPDIVGYRPHTRLMSPQLIINGRDFFTSNREEALVYLDTYYRMPISNFKRVALKHVTGTLIDANDTKAASIMVDRYLLYLTIKDEALLPVTPGSLNTTIDGFYEARKFYVPVTEKQQLSDSGFRPTLYWEPMMVTNQQGFATVSYRNGIAPAQVRIIVEGITGTGKPVSAVVQYPAR